MGAGNLTASWDLCGLSHLAWTAWIPSRAEDGWVGCLSAFQGSGGHVAQAGFLATSQGHE